MKKIISIILTAVISFSLLSLTTVSASTTVEDEGVKYQLSYNGTFYIVDGCSTTIKHLEIADEINGIPVTEISNRAFANKNNLKTAAIPRGISYIGTNPFSGCEALEKIVVENGNLNYHSKNNCLIETETNKLISGCKNSKIPDYVTIISHDAFFGCVGLKTISIPSSVTHIYDDAFHECIKLSKVEFASSGLYWIGVSAFEHCESLKKVYIPSSVEIIEKEAFQFCSSLKKVEIPKSVEIIGRFAFDECTALTDIYCEQENPEDNYWDSNWLGRSSTDEPTVHWNCKMSKQTSFVDSSVDDFDFVWLILLTISATLAALIVVVVVKKKHRTII